MSFSVGGLASGLDTKSIVQQLMQIEARPMQRKEWGKSLWQARESIWKDLNGRLLQLQTKATAINNPSTWTTKGVTSSDPTKATGNLVGPNPTAGDYALNVTALAATERWNAANALAAGTGGVRQSGTWFNGAFSSASASTTLVGLTDVDGTSLGLDAGSTITLAANVNGSAVSASFNVTSTSTLDDLVQWAETQFPGSTFTVNPDGTVTYQSAAGSSNEIDSLSFTAANSSGTALSVFNGTDGASSSFVSAASGGAAASDTLTITQGASTWSIAVGQGDDEATIAALINATAGAGVTATVVGGKLQIDAAASGAAGSFTITSAGSLAADLGLAETTNGQDAQFDINGTAYTRTKNTGITDVITDVSIDLLAITTAPVNLKVENGTASAADIKKKITEFVEQYNSVIDFVNAKSSEKKFSNPKSLAEFVSAPVSQDFGFASVGLDLRRWATDTITGNPDDRNALDDIGITTGAVTPAYSQQNTSGRLVIDEAKLDAALAADPEKVKQIFTGVGGAAGLQDDGITRRVSELVSNWRAGGRVDAAIQGAGRQITEIQRTLDRMDDRLERKRQYYDRMFAALENTLGRMQTQSSWVSGQLAGLMGSAR